MIFEIRKKVFPQRRNSDEPLLLLGNHDAFVGVIYESANAKLIRITPVAVHANRTRSARLHIGQLSDAKASEIYIISTFQQVVLYASSVELELLKWSAFEHSESECIL